MNDPTSALLRAMNCLWDGGAPTPSLVRTRPEIARPRWPYRATSAVAAASYILTSLWTDSPLALTAVPELIALIVASGLGVDVAGLRGIRVVAREVTFAPSVGAQGYRDARPAEVVVDGETIGQVTAVCAVRWFGRDAFTRASHERFEVAMVTAHRVFIVHRRVYGKEEARALAQQIADAIGGGVAAVERSEPEPQHIDALATFLGIVAFFVVLLCLQSHVAPARRALIAGAVVIAIACNRLARSVLVAAAAPQLLRSAYGVSEPDVRGPAIPRRYAIALSIAAYLAVWLSIAVSGGPRIVPR